MAVRLCCVCAGAVYRFCVDGGWELWGAFGICWLRAISRSAQHARSPCPQGFGWFWRPCSFRTGLAGSLDRNAVFKMMMMMMMMMMMTMMMMVVVVVAVRRKRRRRKAANDDEGDDYDDGDGWQS